MNFFDGCVIHFVPLGRDLTRLRCRILGDAVARHGGNVVADPSPDVTHVVTGSSVQPSKIEHIIRKVPATSFVVSAAWITDSVLHGQRLREKEVALQITPAKCEGTQGPAKKQRIKSDTAITKSCCNPCTGIASLSKNIEKQAFDPCTSATGSAIHSQTKHRAAAGSSGRLEIPQCIETKPCGQSVIDAKKTNEFVAQKLEELGSLYSAHGDRWRSWQLAKAARLIRSWNKPLTCSEDFKQVAGLGEKTRAKCCEILATGELERLDALREDAATIALSKFAEVHGAGTAVARKWYAAGCRSLEDVSKRRDELGLSCAQRIGLKYVEDFKTKIPRAEANEIVATVLSAADSAFGTGVMEAYGCGSLRRGNKEEVSDVDIVLVPAQGRMPPGYGLGHLVAKLHSMCVLADDLSEYDPDAPPKSDSFELYMGVLRLPIGNRVHRRVDLVLCTRDHFPFVLLQWTGSGLFVRELHKLATYRGFYLGPTGLWQGTGHHGRPVPCTCEADVFTALGLPYRAPSERELDSEFMQVMKVARSAKSPRSSEPGCKSESGSNGDLATSGVLELRDKMQATGRPIRTSTKYR